ncbi:NAD(P)-binding protein [Hypoxylon cercidicola]|nr:NAD(P)-binding protein [Hypoxylon cercidicola]
MWRPTINDPTIPLGSVILVTGVNGLVASNVADQLLAAGYRVRGTVRNKHKSAWLASVLSARHGSQHFELVEVPDVGKLGAWSSPVSGVSGVAHVIGAVNTRPQDIDQAFEDEMPWQISLLEACMAESSVKSFVFTSSAFAAWSPDASKKVKLTEWDWNETAIALARSNPSHMNGLTSWMALKTMLEKCIWEWVSCRKLPFTFNSILLDTVIGHCLHPREQGIPSTTGMVKWAYDGINLDLLALMQPQWCIDTRDAALLYIATLVTPRVSGERLFGFGARYSWPKVVENLRRLYPGKDLPTLNDNGWDQTDVPNKRSEELLRRVKLDGWATLEESVQAAVVCFV